MTHPAPGGPSGNDTVKTSGRHKLPVERKQLMETIDAVRAEAAQHVLEVGQGFDMVELAGLDEREGDRGGVATARGAGK